MTTKTAMSILLRGAVILALIAGVILTAYEKEATFCWLYAILFQLMIIELKLKGDEE
jgi:hypothetical protein